MKKQIIIGLSLFSCILVYGQNTESQLHFDLGTGYHGLTNNLRTGIDQDARLGFTLNAGYSYYFNKALGIRTGLGFQSFSGISTMNLELQKDAVDASNLPYKYITTYSNWQEKQHALLLDIPLALQYRFSPNPESYNLIGSLGVKAAIPMSTGYKSVNGGKIVTSGYYEDLGTLVTDVPGRFETIKSVPNGSLPLKISYAVTADFGSSFELKKNVDLYFGCYFNYSLNNILKSNKNDLYQYTGAYNGVFSSNMATSMKPLAFGVKVGITLKKAHRKALPPELDADGDGIADSKDKCPDTPKEAIGKLDSNGCPLDTDGDGVPDYLDNCPDTPKESYGKVNANGCPLDSDGDGVPDYLDKCPGTPREATGKTDINGCPLDSDGDGVADYLDKCPATPKEAIGKTDANGCPLDSDLDGVPDYLDKCLDTPRAAIGFVDVNGCPLDSDGDGIFDYIDNCPKVPGVASNRGCPEIKKEVKTLFEEAKHGIKFDLGKRTISAASFDILNKIAATLMENPNYIIDIQGHTDNVGKPEVNLALSEQRAREVKNYLVSRGVEEKRLTYHGFGDSVPVASNATAEGRTLNRRVEFVISFESKEN